MNRATLFVWSIIVLQFCAGVSYLIKKDWRHGLYWLAAASVNLAVTV